jgi:very-short-patch-repair endonuclease
MNSIKQIVRNLRKNQTGSENILWQRIRNRKINGLKFVRQYPLLLDIAEQKKLFVVDFYCNERKLAIEIDGEIHDKQKKFDELREYMINQLGIEIIRFKREEVENDIEKAILILKKILQ